MPPAPQTTVSRRALLTAGTAATVVHGLPAVAQTPATPVWAPEAIAVRR
jgi:hypothetical protein